ncbi:ABC transporter substrate-binding protein [Microtetraspora malaysiensis]|uniref:ABC transporter substrate-binding protein n=1 Tax=Microtetraspora malaysiensis TaxID=161358 RepID=UPI003D8A365F
MSIRKRSTVAVLAVGVLALTGACAKGGGGGAPAAAGNPSSATSDRGPSADTAPKIAIGTADDSKGPAIAPEGVVKGGTISMIDRDDYAHLDPGRIYTNVESVFALVYARQLTGYKRIAKNDYKLVGDLATDTGQASDGGKTWTFTLKDGVKWQDGSPITSGDVKWSIERLFASYSTEGAPYVQQWLTEENYKKSYKGPYDGKHLDNIETPDDKTVVFKFKEPHADANFALAMTTYGIVPKAKDTKEKYDKEPFSCGPYIITNHVTDKSMDLERNPNWDPATDPIRGAYPDKWHLEFGYQNLQATDRFIADAGDDKKMFSFYRQVAPERLQQVLSDPAFKSRLMSQPSPYADYYYFNLDRVKDIKIRQAINYAWPAKQLQQIGGGPVSSVISTTILNPTLAGFQEYDLFNKKAKPEGDVEKAKELLAQSSNPHPTIVYAYNQTPVQERITVAIKTGLEKAGIKVVAKPLNPKTWYDSITKIDNGFDMYWGGWGADWPNAATVFPVIFGPIVEGGQNVSHFKDPEIQAEIKRIQGMSDADEANKAWGALDKTIMEKVTPLVPDVNSIANSLHGSLIGGAEIDPIYWVVSPNTIFVKQQ